MAAALAALVALHLLHADGDGGKGCQHTDHHHNGDPAAEAALFRLFLNGRRGEHGACDLRYGGTLGLRQTPGGSGVRFGGYGGVALGRLGLGLFRGLVIK